MNREIKFRGLRTDGKGWIYGDLLSCRYTKPLILNEDDGNEYEVIPFSAGQFTGLKDKNGVEIYEGEMIHFTWLDPILNERRIKAYREIAGVIANEFGGGNIYAFVGISTNGDNGKTGWYVGRGCFKKVGRLTVTKVK